LDGSLFGAQNRNTMQTQTGSANEWAPQRYDRHAAVVSAFGQDVIDLLGAVEGAQILDLGAGTGDLAAELAKRGARVLGVDASASMVDEARRKYPALQFERRDGQALDFDAQFTHVFSNAALHWMPDAEAVLRGVARALRPGGLFVAEFGGYGCVATARNALAAALSARGEEPSTLLPNWFFPSIGQYAPLLEAHGLTVHSAWLFERPTRFAGVQGLQNWFELFAERAVTHLGNDFPQVMHEIAAGCRPKLWRDDAWWLDYVRIRVVARRVAPSDVTP
jgi:trans-aconitate methyltransferase